jgi:RNA polymerase sigma-70 factor (ECF subfamily)
VDRQQQLTGEFVANRHSLFGFVYGLVRNTHDAEDILQEVWVRFFAAIQRGAEIENQAAWCRGTARNLVLHYWRDRKCDLVIFDPELVDLVGLAFSEQDAHRDHWIERKQALKECLAELPDRVRRLLRMKYDDGLSAQAVSDRVAQTVDAVLKALSRARQQLRDCADRKLRVEGAGA